MSSATKPVPVPRAPPSPRGNWPSKASPTRSSPTTPPATSCNAAKIDLVIVGSDRTLGRTGEVANKIGTYTKAVLAKRHGIPFYVAIPLSTIDWNLASGLDIPIEERNQDEVLGAWGVTQPRIRRSTLQASISSRTYIRIANPSSGAFNPGL